MLTKFRKGANNIFVRILLGLIALSFVGIGGASFLGGNSRGNIITFSKAESIPAETFLALKAREIEYIQRENNINLTEEQIRASGIDKEILQRLINDALIAYLASVYDFEISDEAVIGFVKKMPYFKGKDGKFEIRLFKEAFKNSQRMEDEYLENMKSQLIKTSMLNVFMQSFKPSKLMIDNMVDYLAETRYFDVVSIDLTHKLANMPPLEIKNGELEEFYKNSGDNFTIPELRSFAYLLIDENFFAKKITVSDSEIKSYYDENKKDFEDKSYSSMKKKIRDILFAGKSEEMLPGLAKRLEEDVAAGLALKDIAAKYEIKISSVANASKETLSQDGKGALANVSENIFEMLKGEISYPLEVPDQNKIILAELQDITLARKQEFEEVKDKIRSILQEKAVEEVNLKLLEELRKEFSSGGMNQDSLKAKGIIIKTNQSITRVDLEFDHKINPQLATMLFKVQKGQATGLVQDGREASFAFVKDAKINSGKVKKIMDSSAPQIIGTLKEGVMQELIGYLSEQNEMKTNL